MLAIWPDFMPQLLLAISESLVPAILPANVSMMAPSSETSESRSVWSGVWREWGGEGRTIELALAVEQVDDKTASIMVPDLSQHLFITMGPLGLATTPLYLERPGPSLTLGGGSPSAYG